MRGESMRPCKNILGVGDQADNPSKVAACEGDTVEEVVRNKKGKGCAWVEIADRPARTAVPAGEKVAFLRVVKYMRTNPSIQTRDGHGRWAVPGNVIEFAAELMSIAPRTAHRIHSDFQVQKHVPQECIKEREKILTFDSVFGRELMKRWVREHMLQCVSLRIRVSFFSITKFIREQIPELIADTVPLVGQSDVDALIEAAMNVVDYQKVRRWCLKNGMRVTKLGMMKRSYSAENTRIQALYAVFCRQYLAYAADPDVVFVFTDESYINQYHSRNYAVVDVNDDSTRPPEAKKGMRWCMCTAITKLGEIEVLDRARPDGTRSARWIFCPNKSQKKRQGRDYHSSFCEQSYLPYFKEVLVPACERVFPGRKCVFVFDNATYHVVANYMVAGQHVGRDKSMEVLTQFIEGSGKPAIPRNARGKVGISRAELLVQYDNVVKELGGDLAQFCRTRNHEILLTPPRASDFQPIELFWACTKNAVAAKYTSTRSMESVKEQVVSEFDKWGTAEHCSKLIEHCTKKIQKHHDLIVIADAAAEQAQVVIGEDSDGSSEDGIDSIDEESNEEMSHSDGD